MASRAEKSFKVSFGIELARMQKAIPSGTKFCGTCGRDVVLVAASVELFWGQKTICISCNKMMRELVDETKKKEIKDLIEADAAVTLEEHWARVQRQLAEEKERKKADAAFAALWVWADTDDEAAAALADGSVYVKEVMPPSRPVSPLPPTPQFKKDVSKPKWVVETEETGIPLWRRCSEKKKPTPQFKPKWVAEV